jgi:hypothetical protein
MRAACLTGRYVARMTPMIEQPPIHDVPHPPEPLGHPALPGPKLPGPLGEPEPDIHPVPPPTDPSPPII